MAVTSVAAPLTIDSPAWLLPRARREDLMRLGLHTVRDVLLDFPNRWERFSETAIRDARAGDVALVGRVMKIEGRFARSRRPYARGLVTDGTGVVEVIWLNQPWRLKRTHEGDRVLLRGQLKVTPDGRKSMVSPRTEPYAGSVEALEAADQPVYGLTGKLKQWERRAWIDAALPLAAELTDILPTEVRARHRLPALAEAVRIAHQPERAAELPEARRRLDWEKIFLYQLAFLWTARDLASMGATPVPYVQEVIERFKAGLPFQLTNAQRRAVWEVFKDMEREVPMNRLLNGDVGSGKTAVAAAAAAMAHAAGLQTVVMAPTEILARQHLGKLRGYLETSFPDLKVELLVAGQPAAERKAAVTHAATGQAAVIVGTHALIEERVELARLGLAVVDEQHRFGTRQRELLRAKAGSGRPHFLAMTATPIPRTLALATYGEMALSTMDELPPGRTPIATRVVEEEDDAWALVRDEVTAGHQAFVICPLIEESEKLEARAAIAESERLRTGPLAGLSVGLVHGRMKEKDATMAEFRAGGIQVLVATSVVEVGVDVPNATVMVVEGAERFGLAQLHQLRGRVGRGSAASHCLLIATESGAAEDRLRLLESIDDGFRLAEADLQLRGAGQMFGARQHGDTDHAMAALRSPQLVNEVRDEAERLMAADPDLEASPLLLREMRRLLDDTSLT